MSSQKRKHKRIHPIPVVSSFSPPNLETTYSECTSRMMTPEEHAEVIAKYGPPLMPLHSHKNHYMSGKKERE